ncbi:MAG: chemotaxis protein CheW [Spirochaetota bacterium]
MSGILGEYTEIFLEESEDQIEELNSNLLLLEEDHSNPEIINDIFRAAHSLKSSAAFVGLYNLSDLAHKMENLLQKIREGSLGINTDLVSLLFKCFDLIKSVIDAVAEGEKIETSFDDMIAKLVDYENTHLGGAPAKAAPQETSTAPASESATTEVQQDKAEAPAPVSETTSTSEETANMEPASSSDDVKKIDLTNEELEEIREECRLRSAKAYDVNVTLRKDTQMKGLRYALILQNLKDKGVVYKSVPDEAELESSGGEISVLCFVFLTEMDEFEIKKDISVDMVESVLVARHDVGEDKPLTDDDIVPLVTDNDENAELEEEIKTKKAPAYDIYVTLKADTPMKGLRFTLILQNLKNHASIYKSDPPLEQLETGTDKNHLTFIAITPLQPNQIKKEILVDMVEVILVKQRKVPASNGYIPKKSTSVDVPAKPSNVPANGYGSRSQQKKQPTKDDSGANSAAKVTLKSIKVSSEKLDQLMNNVGELVITNSGFQKIYDDMIRKFGDDVIFAELKSKIDQINRISKDLQSGIMNTRMVPIGSVFSRFSRLVRDLSIETNKKVKLNLLGENTELDKKVVDMIGEPLLHLIRNSIDHGIEEPEDRVKVGKPEYGTVELNAYQGGNNIMVEIRDDGKGLNKEGILNKAMERGLVTSAEASGLSDNDIYQFIFAPGFSTSQEVTDISGRGVGMNVVNKLIQDFKGKILINTQQGIGTSFTLCFPQALAIIPSILVSMEEEIYAFPLSEVFETIRVQKDQINTLEGHEIINLRGEVLPIYRLNKILHLSTNESVDEFPVVIVNFNSRKLGFIVDDLIGKHETVIKTLEKNFRNIGGITGASLMGDGTIIVVLDITGLIEIASNQEMLRRSSELKGQEMNRINISRSIDLNESNQIYKTLNSTNIYNTKLVEIQEATRSKRKKEKQRRLQQIQQNQALAKKELEEKASAEKPLPNFEASASYDSLSTGEKPVKELSAPTPVSKRPEPKPEPEEIVVQQPETPPPSQPEPVENVKSETPPATSGMEDAAGLTDEELNAKIRENIAEQMRERTDSIVSERKEIADLMTKDQIRKLESVVNTGMMNAGLVLSQLVGSNVELYMPEITLTDKDLLVDELRYSDEALVGLKIRMNGDMNGNLLMIISEEQGRELASQLLQESQSDLAKKLSEDTLSVLVEISNIVCASVINSLSNKSKSQIMPSVPEVNHGDLRAVLDSVKPEKTKFLSMNTEFIYDGGNLIGNLIFLPDFDELIALIDKLP